jgi:hypothetical protein
VTTVGVEFGCEFCTRGFDPPFIIDLTVVEIRTRGDLATDHQLARHSHIVAQSLLLMPRTSTRAELA